jgi:hypothetical protein
MHHLFVLVAASTQQCTELGNTDFNGHDLQPLQRRDVSSPAECCDLCGNNTGCTVWTFMPPRTCYLKDSAAGQRSMPNYVSGCLGACPPGPPAPTPPPPPPPPAPIPRGGGTCSDEWDCSLAGDCHKGKCTCDAQYTGSHCGVLRLRKAKVDNGLQANSTATHTWGGHALKDAASGKWVGYFSYMAAGCGLHNWQSNSMIISAVAESPDGPYDKQMRSVTAPYVT